MEASCSVKSPHYDPSINVVIIFIRIIIIILQAVILFAIWRCYSLIQTHLYTITNDDVHHHHHHYYHHYHHRLYFSSIQTYGFTKVI